MKTIQLAFDRLERLNWKEINEEIERLANLARHSKGCQYKRLLKHLLIHRTHEARRMNRRQTAKY
jgi:hypothetical protein